MKILFVNNFRSRGGGEEFLRDLLPGLIEKGVKVGLVCRPGTPLTNMFAGTAILVYPISRSGWGALTSVFTIAGIIRKGGYEIINIQRGHDIVQSWIAAFLSRIKPRLMYTVQVPEFMRSRFLLSRMDAVIAVSRYIRDRITSFYPAISSRISVINYGIDADTFSPSHGKKGFLRSRFGIPAEALLIGTVGDLWKNQIEFLEALVEIRKERPDARFVLVASETSQAEVQDFKQRVRELGLHDAVLWAGRLSKDAMRSFYADITLAVTTHRNEGFGIWILEAMAMEKPVVALHEGGVRDPLEGCPAGILVSGGAKQMANEILRLSQDRQRFEKMARSGPEWVRNRFSRDRMIGNYYAFFKTLSSDKDAFSTINTGRGTFNVLQMISKNDRYGAQRIFLDQVAILHRMGHSVVVVGRGSEGYVPDEVRSLGVEYHGISLKGLKDIFFLRQLIKKYSINVIHTTLDRADYVGVILSKMTGVPVVSTMMVPRYHIGFRFADRVIVLSNKQRDLLLQKNIKPEKIIVIRPGIDVERFANPDPGKREAWRRKLKTDDYGLIFCHIASIIPRKAHAVSIELVYECKKRGENPLLIIIGDPLSGEYYESLVRKIADLGLERNVLFTGWTSEIPEILSLSHFTVLPSENEALGIVLMEGMAAGTPIIAREGEGGAELVEEYDTGFLFKPENGASDMAEKVLAIHRDEARYQDLSSRCRQIATDEYSLPSFGERLEEVYRQFCK